MSKKKPRSKDPHSWVKDTTKKAGAASGSSASKPETAEAVAADEEPAEGAPRRLVIVEYEKNGGDIIATHEVVCEWSEDAVADPPSGSETGAVVRILLTGELFEKTLLDIHENYKVDVSGARPKLVPRK